MNLLNVSEKGLKKYFSSLNFLFIVLLVTCISIPSVLSWGATRSISGNDVTITVDVTKTTGYIIRENIPAGLTVVSAGQGGYINTDLAYVQWIFTANLFTELIYSTTGSGTIYGVMTAGDPASEKPITGDTVIRGVKAAAEICDDDLDNDNDDLKDCDDPDCDGDPACAVAVLGDSDSNGCLSLTEYTDFKYEYRNGLLPSVTLTQYTDLKYEFQNNIGSIACP